MYQRILVPIDGSAVAQRALDEALALAAEKGSKLRLLHVIETSAALVDPAAFLAYDQLMSAWRTTGESLLAKARELAASRGIAAETVLRETTQQRAAAAIVAEADAWPCDLIVMGTHGRRGISHLLLGSDAELVLRTSRVPVLLVRGGK